MAIAALEDGERELAAYIIDGMGHSNSFEILMELLRNRLWVSL